MFTDFVLNGSAVGEVAGRVAECGWDSGLLRPYKDERGRVCVTVNTGQVAPLKDKKTGAPITNEDGSPKYVPVYEKQLVTRRMMEGLPVPLTNATTLRKDQWIRLDEKVLAAARARLRAWADLRAANTYGGFDGMANPILEHERVNDPGEAVVDMDGMTEGRSFAPKFDLVGLPLPITHSDFWLSSRFLATSRNKGQPADTLRAEFAGRRVAEMIEKTLIGTITGTTYGDSTDYASTAKIYGYTNHPDRLTKTDLTIPTSSNGTTILDDWLACRELLYGNNFYGPFMVYTSTDYDQYLDNDFKTYSDLSVRERLLQIEGVQGIRRLDYLTPTDSHAFTMIWVQMTEDVARAVNGMEITTVQWETMGGMRLNFKVMGIQVPQLRSDFNGKMGLLHARTA